ncbi:MAG: P-II family nitrogen regulator [Candidatus Nanopelagicales bacterium]|jgi:nitrogen regulatory protein P-II 2
MSEHGSVTCLTIVAESVLEERLLAVIDECGAKGWTVSMAQGHGPSHHGVSGIEGGNVRVETLVSDEVAASIWRALERDFFPHYAVSAWAYDVRVARVARYS